MKSNAKKGQKRFPVPIVEVEWDDAAVKGRWLDKASYMAEVPVRCRTSGYLLKSDNRCVVIVQSQGDSGDVADSMAIPRGCVRRVSRLLARKAKR